MLPYLLNIGFCIIGIFGGSYLIHASNEHDAWWNIGAFILGLLAITGAVICIFALSLIYVTGLGR